MEAKEKKKLGLTTKIFIGLLVGVLFNIAVPTGYIRDTVFVDGIFYGINLNCSHHSPWRECDPGSCLCGLQESQKHNDTGICDGDRPFRILQFSHFHNPARHSQIVAFIRE